MTNRKLTPTQTEALRQLAILGGETGGWSHTNWLKDARWVDGLEDSQPQTNYYFFGESEDENGNWIRAYKANMRTVRVLIDRGLVAIDTKNHPEGYACKISLTEQGRAALR